MARVPLTDDSSKWFDNEKAVKFGEDTWWDGRNRISRATGSQWNHEVLYYTKGGNWILNAWSQYQGSGESYETVSEETAIAWLISQKCFEDDGLAHLPKSVQESVKAGFAVAEL